MAPKTQKAKKPTKKAAAPKAPLHPYKLNGKDWDRKKVMDILCAKIAGSNKSMATLLAEGHEGHSLPTVASILEWLAADAALSVQYARAKEEQADFLGEEFLELHKKAWIPVMVGDVPLVVDGKPVMTVSPASAAAVRLEADNKKWLMSKLRPKKYGDKLQVGGAHDLPPIDTHSMTADERAARIAELRRKIGTA